MTRREVFMVNAPDQFVSYRAEVAKASAEAGPVAGFKAELLLAIAMYSRGDKLEDVRKQYLKAADRLEKGLKQGMVKLNLQNSEEYYCALWALSMAIVFGEPSPAYAQMAGGQDHLFDQLLMSTGAPVTPAQTCLHGANFNHLADVLKTVGNHAETMQGYLRNWYDGLKSTSWHDKHLQQEESFFGYWAFEVAAVVKITNLDDDLFADNIFYPRDLVHQRLYRTWVDSEEGNTERNLRTADKAKRNISDLGVLLKGFFADNNPQKGKAIESKAKETAQLLSALIGLQEGNILERPELFRQSLLHLMHSVVKVTKDALEVTQPNGNGPSNPKVKEAFKQMEKQLGLAQPNFQELEKALKKETQARPDSANVVAEARAKFEGLHSTLSGMLAENTLNLAQLLDGLEEIADAHAEQFGIQRPKGHDVEAEVGEQVRKSLDEARKGKAMDENFDWSSLWRKD